MYAFTVSVDIGAPPARVWRALCDPAEVVQWDTGVAAALDAPPDYPRPGQHVRWRYTNGPFRTLHDRPQAVVPERTLRSLLGVGPFRFDETYTLAPHPGSCRLTAAMLVRVPIPLVGVVVEHCYLGPRTQATVAASLEAIKHHCERSACC
ncbi:MAG: SRPBCC family protein [Deltaproteobacteria bacterium]|nr:SRPBCC family protein [Deltaproteobacteria bacterium]